MQLRHLRYFIAAAEEEHFGRAAEKLHVTRPAVSKLIADLESELGMLLFERQSHRITLTPAGRNLLPDVKAVMLTLTDAFAAAKKVSEGRSGTLKIGYGTLTLHNELFRASIKKFKETHPEVSLRLIELPACDQPQALAEGRIHAGFMHFGTLENAAMQQGRHLLPMQDESILDWFTIETGCLGVVMEKSHALSGREYLTVQDLAQERFVDVPTSVAIPGNGMLHVLCQPAGFEPDIVQEVHSIAAMLNLVSVDIGIGLIPVGKHFRYPPPLRVVPLRPVTYSTRFVLGWLQGRSDPLVEALLQIVRDVVDNRCVGARP